MRPILIFVTLIVLGACVPSASENPSPTTATTPGFRLALAPENPLPRSPLGIDDVHSTMEIPEVRALLRSIASTLLVHAPDASGLPYVPDIHLTSDGYGALATSTGDILIGIGVVGKARNEDELAFVLAHELSHLQEDHLSNERESSDLDNLISRLFGVLGTAQEMVTRARRSGVGLDDTDSQALDESIAALVASLRALQAIQTGIIAPAYNREQELEADAAALRMMSLAGYNPNPAKNAIRNAGEAQQAVYHKVVYAIRSAANAAKVIFQIGQKYDLLGTGSLLPFDPTELVFEIATSTLVSVFCEFSESHPTTADRNEQLAELLETELSWVDNNSRKKTLTSIRGSKQYKAKANARSAAIVIRNELEKIKVKMNPLSDHRGCGEQEAAETQQSVRDQGDRLAQQIGGDDAAGADESKPEYDPSKELGKLAEDALQSIRDQKAAGVSDPAFGWLAFAEVRAEQKRYKDASQNIGIGLRTTEASPMLMRRLAVLRAEHGDHDLAMEQYQKLTRSFDKKWIPDLKFEIAILSGDVTGIVSAAIECRLAENFFVQERCIMVSLAHRKKLDEIGIDENSYTPINKDNESFWDTLF